jgi:hypothetical protein
MNGEEELIDNYIKYCGTSNISEAMKEVITNIGRPRRLLAEVPPLLLSSTNP